MRKAPAKKITHLPIYTQRMIQIMYYCINKEQVPTQEAFLRELDLHPQALSQILSGKQGFLVKHILYVAKKYNIDCNYIFGFTDIIHRKPGKSAVQNLKAALSSVESLIK